MNNTNVFPERLKEMRLKRGMTQKELGEKVGVKQNTFTNWENGKREPNFDNLIKLAEFLNVSVDKLLGVKIEDNQTAIGMFELLEEYLDDQCDNISFLESDYRAGYEQALEDVSEFVSDLASEDFSLQDMYDEYSRHC